MLVSNINSEINYKQDKSIAINDIDYESYIYKGQLFKTDIEFVLGKPCFDHVKKNIVYVYIYLVYSGKVYSKIGLYEFLNDIYTSIIDEEGFIMIEKLDLPLIFDFTKNIIINEYRKLIHQHTEESDKELDSESDLDSDLDSDIDSNKDSIIDSDLDSISDNDEKFSKLTTTSDKTKLLEQTREESEKEYLQYQFNPQHTWVSQFMHVNKYTLHDNEGGGDCFFAVLRDALRSKGINTSILEIRKKLANEADNDIFKEYFDLYDMIYKQYVQSNKDKIQAKNEFDATKIKLKSTHLLITEKQKLFDTAKQAEQKFKDSNLQMKNNKELLDELKFMNGISNIQSFRDKIQTSSYWADVWAISTLEKIYNVKFIILSQNHFKDGDLDNILQCGEINKTLKEKNIFQPDYYILADYIQSIHYKLIKYMDRPALSFNELPYKIKELISNKCLEKLAGPFSIIPDFVDFKNKLPKTPLQTSNKSTPSVSISKSSNLYQDYLHYVIYSRSADTKPGKGNNETIIFDKLTMSDKQNIASLTNIKNWRRMLDNNYENIDKEMPLFEKDGKPYSSVTEYLSKFKKQDITDKLIQEALLLKFTNPNNKHLLQVLLLTGNSKISLYTPRIGLTEFNNLMLVRNYLHK
tara:strand:- start:365 stop:2272 length:1908 start_codon:yes stop_codon:yes gene_type:complete